MSQDTAHREAAVLIDAPLNDGAERHLADDVLDGLTRPFKELPPKHFYDARGSELFERICALPDYYPTRTELAILRERAADIVSDAGGPAELVELGCGSTVKARLLLDAMTRNGGAARYVPVDVSERVVIEAAEALTDAYPGLQVHGVVGDFERHLDRVPSAANSDGRLIAFLGGTIGNFPPGSRRRMLREIAGLLGRGDHVVLGTDLVKDPAVIEAAYDDPDGVTAEFNRNVLHVMNRELGANFEPSAFEHVAFFDRRREWVEMRLRARRPCTVRIADLDLDVEFAAGEELRTEISAKFTRDRLDRDYAAAGLELRGWYADPDDLFAVTLARRVD
ncbi:MAG: L-histidine Nalpha-methyltransferase [Solirubrobacteraceae bacterium]|nr:L-histidine Nalpha-methyltransferase [Solirubrobacteraceae bacterium]